jgi:hypothetical protein
VAKIHFNVPRSVTIGRDNGEWVVHVRDGAGASEAKSFILEKYARNFAEGQRIRLGLETIEQHDPEPLKKEAIPGDGSDVTGKQHE